MLSSDISQLPFYQTHYAIFKFSAFCNDCDHSLQSVVQLENICGRAIP